MNQMNPNNPFLTITIDHKAYGSPLEKFSLTKEFQEEVTSFLANETLKMAKGLEPVDHYKLIEKASVLASTANELAAIVMIITIASIHLGGETYLNTLIQKAKDSLRGG